MGEPVRQTRDLASVTGNQTVIPSFIVHQLLPTLIPRGPASTHLAQVERPTASLAADDVPDRLRRHVVVHSPVSTCVSGAEVHVRHATRMCEPASRSSRVRNMSRSLCVRRLIMVFLLTDRDVAPAEHVARPKVHTQCAGPSTRPPGVRWGTIHKNLSATPGDERPPGASSLLREVWNGRGGGHVTGTLSRECTYELVPAGHELAEIDWDVATADLLQCPRAHSD